MTDWDRSSTSDNASVVSADLHLMVALETTNEETSKLEFSEDEEMLIAKMFNLVGERWSLIAGRIPGRTADEIEKYWNSRYSKNEGENLPDQILLIPKDHAQSIGLKGEEIKGPGATQYTKHSTLVKSGEGPHLKECDVDNIS